MTFSARLTVALRRAARLVDCLRRFRVRRTDGRWSARSSEGQRRRGWHYRIDCAPRHAFLLDDAPPLNPTARLLQLPCRQRRRRREQQNAWMKTEVTTAQCREWSPDARGRGVRRRIATLVMTSFRMVWRIMADVIGKSLVLNTIQCNTMKNSNLFPTLRTRCISQASPKALLVRLHGMNKPQWCFLNASSVQSAADSTIENALEKTTSRLVLWTTKSQSLDDRNDYRERTSDDVWK